MISALIDVTIIVDALSLLLLLLLLPLLLFNIRVNGDRNAAWRLWMLLIFEFFFVTSESPPCFPFLVSTLRQLDSFLLQTWCSEMSTFLGNAWLHKNSFCFKLCLSSEFIIKVLIVPALHFYCYLSTALTFILDFLFCIFLLGLCVIFVLCSCFALLLK